MAYVITQKCIGTCDTACVDVCPCDCIRGPIDLDAIRSVPADARPSLLSDNYISPSTTITSPHPACAH